MNQSNRTEKRHKIVKQFYLHDNNNINNIRLLNYINYSYMKTQIETEVHVVNVCNNTKTCESSKCMHCYFFSSTHL